MAKFDPSKRKTLSQLLKAAALGTAAVAVGGCKAASNLADRAAEYAIDPDQIQGRNQGFRSYFAVKLNGNTTIQEIVFDTYDPSWGRWAIRRDGDDCSYQRERDGVQGSSKCSYLVQEADVLDISDVLTDAGRRVMVDPSGRPVRKTSRFKFRKADGTTRIGSHEADEATVFDVSGRMSASYSRGRYQGADGSVCQEDVDNPVSRACIENVQTELKKLSAIYQAYVEGIKKQMATPAPAGHYTVIDLDAAISRVR